MQAGMLRLNSTVWYSRNSTGDAPSNSPPVGYGVPTGDAVHCPTESNPGYESWRQQSDTLVIHHNGHQVCTGSLYSAQALCTPHLQPFLAHIVSLIDLLSPSIWS